MTTTYTRQHPFHAPLTARRLLTAAESTKLVYHIELNLRGSQINYQPGDCIAILPKNNEQEVDALLELGNLSGDQIIEDERSNNVDTLRNHLLHRYNLYQASQKSAELIIPDTCKQKLTSRPEQKAYLSERHIRDLMLERETASLDAEQFLHALQPLIPRFYSIASSQKEVGESVHLTVGHVSYQMGDRKISGVGSDYLCTQCVVGQDTIALYHQPTKHFLLPEDPTTPIIMIGPGTGLAPFRGFLQERAHTPNRGPAWLFFGERNQKTDFYYEQELNKYIDESDLRLSCAFSRDQQERIYVQHRLLDQSKEIWKWLESGAVLYVCGDAKKMAKDVQAALIQIITEQSQLSPEEASHFLKELRKTGRYLRDVY